ncbi:hypothetical protein [Marinibactrum halimedae]|uniref:Uncharacterized protein n=1 Tax=Marinibactrum halimedae TaxID=1444977 RepID=A0AA37WN86_9GAMM|nr:hypothetical protein [Marinibactrum halimedae]MCD9460628.1 hypothetical protein [Marinibactrum halimedae]GLS27844.1 hypothetical protein GCM10007877_35630 [Marinibactrum halimedae]
MPVFINEVIADIQAPVVESTEAHPSAHQQPLSVAEIELSETLDRIRQRQERLLVD